MSTKNYTILLVEDDATTQFLIQDALDSANLAVSVQAVDDGVGAIHYLTGQAPYADRQYYPLPTMILTDVNLPHVSGLELLAWVKQQVKLMHIPVVMMSSSEDRSQANQATKLGANAYFVKMSSLDKLIAMVAALLVQ